MTTFSFETGIQKLDEHLRSTFVPGKHIISGAVTGGGKTVFAGQLATQCVVMGRRVRVVSTETPVGEFTMRCLANACSYEYANIVNGIQWEIGGILPSSEHYPSDFCYQAADFIIAARDLLTFEEVDIHEPLDKQVQDLGRDLNSGDILIFDYIQERVPQSRELDSPKFRFSEKQDMIELASSLQSLASEKNILVFSFAQIHPAAQKKGLGLKDFVCHEALGGYFDALIGISRLAIEDDHSENVYSKTQYFNVSGSELRDTCIPVTAAFEYQRFEDHSLSEPRKLLRKENERKFTIERSEDVTHRTPTLNGAKDIYISHQGYILLGIDTFFEVCSLGHKPSLILYIYLLLVGSHSDRKRIPVGSSYHSRATITERTGLSDKQIRVAARKLAEAGFIRIKPKRHSRSILYTVSEVLTPEIAEMRELKTLKLYRSLRDDRRSEIMSDPDIFLLWIYCLVSARAGHSGEYGSFHWDWDMCQERTGISTGTQEHALYILEKRGSLICEGENISMPNWSLYQGNSIYPPRKSVAPAISRTEAEGELRAN